MASSLHSYPIFGGARPWDSKDWTASDDRVRGGKSQSFIDCSTDTATFHGTLDIKTLGGAGFASQRTTGEDRQWDLSRGDGILIKIVQGDKKTYTLILKDELLPPDPDSGREQSTISYEFDFKLSDLSKSTGGSFCFFIPWSSFKPTYRGREKKDAPPIQLKHIRRISIMNRSFFGGQEGDFTLTICSLEATSSPSAKDSLEEGDDESICKPLGDPVATPLPARLSSWLLSCLGWSK